MNVLLFDARNHGQSDTHSFSSLPRFAEDLDSALAWLHANHPAACEKLVLLGHSVGAGAVLLAASRRTDIAAVISVSAFAHPEWVMRRYLQTLHLPNILIRIINRYAVSYTHLDVYKRQSFNTERIGITHTQGYRSRLECMAIL